MAATEHRPDAAIAGRWDVIVVGAGPAGSTAARRAAESGAKTLIFDRAEFPRYKTCGGGLLGVSTSIIPAAAADTIEQRISEAVFTLRGRDPVRVSGATPFLAMVRREQFDAALLGEAIRAGAQFVGGATLRSIDERPDGTMTLVTSAGTAEAVCVIGADGTSGRVGRYVGVIPERVDLGLEDELETDAGGPPRTVVRLDWGRGPGSYAWVFPKASVDTVGVVEAKGSADRTRKYLRAWVDEQPGADAPVERSSGHLTQWRTADSPLRRGAVLVAGDAAGLLEPWTREGISFALRSGRLAGAAAAAFAAARDPAALDAYVDQVEAQLQPEIRMGAMLLAVFEVRPALVHRLLKRSRRARAFFMAFCAGEAGLGDLERRRWFVRAVRALGGRPRRR